MSNTLTAKSSSKSKPLAKIPTSLGDLDLPTDIRRHLTVTLGHFDDGQPPMDEADRRYLYRALAISVRDQLVPEWQQTWRRMKLSDDRKVYYLSLEFLIGRSLTNAIQNLDLDEETRAAMHAYGMELEDVADRELDAGLGNGGLGRLAACFLDSCANLQLPVVGYGIRYEYGMFHQHIENGRQVEDPDHWLRDGNPWEIVRAESTRRIRFYGRTEQQPDDKGKMHPRLVGTHDVLAVPFDMPIPGYRNKTVNTLRLWKASTTDVFDLAEFNAGSYTEAVATKIEAEQISMVLYPNDASENGKELRLKQQYFLVSASLQDVIDRWVNKYGEDFSEFGQKNCFQLNDTHPACAVPELMRLLLDEHGLQWDEAWDVTTRCMAYTNHTLLPEALERWSVALFSRLLPRLLEIIYEINARFLKLVDQQWPGDVGMRREMSLIEESDNPHIRMAYLAIVGSFSVNGVAGLHTQLLESGLFKNFAELWPRKFNNKTNGVTQRRWLAHCNPGLRDLLNETIGDGWQTNLTKISQLAPHATDPTFQSRWQAIKLKNKKRLSELVAETTGVDFDTSFMFDVQVKRIHEYKRQLLNVLHVIHLYDRIQRGETTGMVPRCVLIGGKAAPGYHVAKLIVKLINDVASVINADEKCRDVLRMVFFPNYRVSSMEVICPATELSEQISTAGKEASGTGNMKFMMNGALTIGTLDGANIEIRENAGEENFFLFGLDAAEVVDVKKDYRPNEIIAADPDIARLMSILESGTFNRNNPGLYDLLTGGLRSPHDPWVTIADLRSYIDAQGAVGKVYQDSAKWNEMSIRNTAGSGWFSSDRTIGQYAQDIWDVHALPPLK